MRKQNILIVTVSLILAVFSVELAYLKRQSKGQNEAESIFKEELPIILSLTDNYVYRGYKVKGTFEASKGLSLFKSKIYTNYEVYYGRSGIYGSVRRNPENLVCNVTVSETIFGKVVEFCEKVN
jgi:hypothetical protein